MSEDYIKAVGIDLGTTFSCAAQVHKNGSTSVILNSYADPLTPSAVLFDDKEIAVGKEARKVSVLKAGNYAECVKRDMGQPRYSRAINGNYIPPEVIQAYILKDLRGNIEREVGEKYKVVITVPAYFDEPRRKATADAAAMAGLPILDIVNEPTAAALSFGEILGYLAPTMSPREKLTTLVYDLGGGTFDVTLIVMEPGDLRTIATDGDARLGGIDWDNRLVRYAAEEFIAKHGEDPRQSNVSGQRLVLEAEQAKRTLTARREARIHVEHNGKSIDVPVTRAKFEELTADLLERTAHTVREVLKSGKLGWDQVDHLLLVGGATRMPMVRDMLQHLSGKAPDHRVHPDEAVARGAALYCRYLLDRTQGGATGARLRITDVNSHSLGIEGIDAKNMDRRNVILIPRNTPLPVIAREKFTTRSENQRSIVLQVLEGESVDPEACAKIGRTVIRDLPAGLPLGWPIEVCFAYETNGRLKIHCQVPGTDKETQIQLERDAALNSWQLEGWSKAVKQAQGIDDFEKMVGDILEEPAAPREPAFKKTPAARPVATPEFTPVAAPQPPTSAKSSLPTKPNVPGAKETPATRKQPPK